MRWKYHDGFTLDECIEAMRQARTLDDRADRLHGDTEYLGRLLQLPTAEPIQLLANASEFDLWSGDRLDEVL